MVGGASARPYGVDPRGNMRRHRGATFALDAAHINRDDNGVRRAQLLCERIELGPGERALVGTGLTVAIPDGHAGFVQPRSGLAARHGITVVNSPGLIDSGYRGEIRVVLLNTDPSETFRVAPGDRIAQLVVLALPQVRIAVTDELPGSERAHRGFGSSAVGSPP